jgi:hypothetical protein
VSEWRIAGRYFESCNCEAICPCRMIGGRPGGRSTYGECLGVLAWAIDDGIADGVELGGLLAGLTLRYDDDEPGSPWRFILHVDERAASEQADALRGIFLGERGGDVMRLPWLRKPSELIEVRSSAIALTADGPGYELRIGAAVDVRANRPVETDETVACVIPGYERPGTELYTEHFVVDDTPYAWELAGNCAFATDFDYRSDE